MKNILIDTDVILDFFFDRTPFSEDATGILSMCESGDVNGYLTPVIISNTYYLLRRTSGHRKVIEKLNQLMTILKILYMDKDSVMSALRSDFKDFEDALQNYAAENSGIIDVIVTRNVKDYSKSKIGVMTPKNYVKGFK